MKKILTVLLAFTMCFCLINIKNNNVKADQETNASVTMVSGSVFHDRVINYLNNHTNVEEIVFTNVQLPTDNYVDLSADNSGLIRGYVSGDAFYITANTNKIMFNPDSSYMFARLLEDEGAFKFDQITEIDFGNGIIDTSEVTNMKDMFYNCFSLERLDLSQFDTSKVTTMEGMFCECHLLESIEFGNNFCSSSSLWNTESMFSNCWSLNEIKLPSVFDCSSVTHMKKMFSTCLSLKVLDISSFNTDSVVDAERFIHGCIQLVRIYADPDTTYFKNATNTDHMFWNCISLVGGNGTSYDLDHLDGNYAKVDKEGNNGYFTDKAIVVDKEVKVNKDNGKFYAGQKEIKGLTYDSDTHTVTMDGVILDSSAQDTIDLPDDTKVVNVKGVNSIVNINYDPEAMFIEDDELITFEGDGELIAASLNGTVMSEDRITVNGPTLALYACVNDGAGITANEVNVNKGTILTGGEVGLQLYREDEDMPVPKLTITDGRIYAYGIYSGFNEYIGYGEKVGLDAVVKGSVYSYDDLTKLTNDDLKSEDTENEGSYSYYIGDDIARYVEISPIIKPVDPTPGTDEMKYDETHGFVDTFTKGQATTATAHILGASPEDKVTITENGVDLPEGSYVLKEGSLKVTFQPAYLNSLSVGKHILNINVNDIDLIVTITVNSNYVPTKDESCEKVIGPTWHWNNKKGICEDTGVVKTYTR